MSSRRRIRFLWTVLALAAPIGAAANAQTPCSGGAACTGSELGTIAVSDRHGPQVPAWSDVLALPAFDARLGELVRVDVSATAPFEGLVGFENLGSQACAGGTWTMSCVLDLDFDQGALAVFDAEPVGASSSFGPLAPFDGAFDYGGSSGQTTSFADAVVAQLCFDEAAALEAFRSDVSGPQLTFAAATSMVSFGHDAACASLAHLNKLHVGIELELTYTYCVRPGVAFCSGDGSGAPCPCANSGSPDHGCGNGSFAGGAALDATGTPSVSGDTLILGATSSAPGQPGLFFQGDHAVGGGDGQAFGDGLRCAGGSVVRLQTATADGAGSAASSIAIAAAGGVAPGDLRRYQWWYRDPLGSPCDAGFNLSNGFEVLWGP